VSLDEHVALQEKAKSLSLMVESYAQADAASRQKEFAMQHGNTVQCIAVRCIAMQCNAMQCSVMQCNAMQFSAIHAM
jgi:hypothetical protein